MSDGVHRILCRRNGETERFSIEFVGFTPNGASSPCSVLIVTLDVESQNVLSLDVQCVGDVAADVLSVVNLNIENGKMETIGNGIGGLDEDTE